MKYWLTTYGCQMNKSDSERIATVLENIGYKLTSKLNKADLIVINMCSVRQSAVDRIYGKIFDFAKLKAQNSKLKTLLTGCILKEDFKKFKKGFDLILNIKELPNWPKHLRIRNYESRIMNYLNVLPKYQTDFQAFIPISNGCNNFCTYCVVPFARGPLVCRNHKEILKKVENVVRKGFKEIWLLGQNVNNYHSPTDSAINFPKLLKTINEIQGKFWIRFTSSHPEDFSDELIETMAKCEKVTPYLNLPAQSGDNEILRKMNRPYTIKKYKNLVKKIREAFKKYRKKLESEVAISTDVIVGFPGETERQFQNTVKLLKEIKFDMAYIAQYSPRTGTAAAKMKDTIPYQEKKRRREVLTEILKKTALERNKKYIGKIIEVLPEYQRKGFLIGKSWHYKTVKIVKSKFGIPYSNLISQFVKVKIINAFPWGLRGKLIENG